MRLIARLLAAALLGAALVLAFPPFDAWPVAPLACSGLILLLYRARPAIGALTGFAYGLGFFLPLLHWSGTYVGTMPWVLLALSQAVPVAIFGALAGPVTRLSGWPVWIAALWVAGEALRSRAPFGGFPWGRLAFSQADAPLVRLAALGGAPLVSFAVALAAALLAYAVTAAQRGSVPRAALGAAACLLAITGGFVVPLAHPTGPRVRVAVVQGNVPRLGLDFNAQRQAVLRNHVTATVELADQVRAGAIRQPDLVIWPENSSDIDPFDDPTAAALIDAAARAIGVPILVGAVLNGPGNKVTNAGIVWDPRTGAGQRYVKRHPVPFGEYIPLRGLSRSLSKKVDLVGHDMYAGDRPGVLQVGPARVGDVICFEVAYDGIVRDTVTRGAQVLVVQTNNATFGRSAETVQQLAMGRLRAVEHGRYVLVAATSGISAVIGPDGTVVDKSGVFARDVLVESIALSRTRTLASRVGSLPEWLLILAAGAAVSTRVVQSRRERREDGD
ncbi:MAG: apolipoprotein N-acyltransferase [Mycobacteriales bacterium]